MSYGASNVTAGALAYTANTDGSVTDINGDAVFSGTPQTAIEKAMSLCPIGKHIELGRGEYAIGPQLRFYRSIIGNGAKLYTNGPISGVTQYLIAAPTGQFGPSNMVKDIIISGLELDGNTEDYAAKTYGGLQARYARNVIIENCKVHDFPQSHGIQLQSGYYCTVRGCTISGIGDMERSGHYGNGICSGQMYMESDANYPAANNLVEDCDISLCSMVGLNWEPGNNNLSRRVVVHDILPYWLNGSKKVRSRAVTTFSKTGLGAQNGNIYEDCSFTNDGVASSFNGGSVITRRTKFSTPKATDEYGCGWALFIKDGDGSIIEDCDIQYISGTSAGHGISFVSTVGATISGTKFDTKGTGGIDIYKDANSKNIVVKAIAGTPTTEATEDAEPGYIVTKDGQNYVATSNAGKVLASGTDAAMVINAALNGLTAERTTKEKVTLQTSATLVARIEMPSWAVLECADGVVLTGAGNNQLLGSKSTHDWEVRGAGEWICTYGEAKSSASPFYFTAPKNCLVEGAKVRDSLWNNIIVDNAEGMVFRGVESYHSWAVDPANINATGWSGIIFQMNAKNCLVEDCYLHDCGHGGCYFYSNEDGQTGALNDNIMRNNRVERCGCSGLSISQRSSVGEGHRNIIEGNKLTDCGIDTQHPFINVGWKSCYPAEGNIVRNNVLVDNGIVGPTGTGADQGIINQGSNTEIYGNDIQGVTGGIVLLCGSGLKVHDNNIHDAPQDIAILIGSSVKDSSIENNTWSNVKTGISGAGVNNVIRNNGPPVAGQEPTREGGFNDAVILSNMVKGGAVARTNKAFGSSGNANSGSETKLEIDDEWPFLCTYMAGLKAQGVDRLRGGFHDWQTTAAMLAAGAPAVAEKALILLDAASLYGIKVTLVIGGFSDASTAAQGAALFEQDSALYAQFISYAAQIADELHSHEALELLELVNEPDYVSITWPTLSEFLAWENNILSDVRLAQAMPGVPLGMGTAVDSTLYAIDWWGEISGQSQIIDAILRPCDVASVHTYIGDDNANARDVWVNQKLPAFVASAKRLGKRLIVGETGLLSKGGVWDAEMATALKASGLPYCWMVRWWMPTEYTIPATLPPRPDHSPASEPNPDSSSDETPETPPPAQEPADDPQEPVEEPPAAVEEPAVVEPVTPEPSEPPTTGPTPGSGKNVLVELVRWLFSLFSKRK